MNAITLIGLAMGIGFTAGIRLYSTVLLIGLGMRYGVLHLPPEYAHLQALADSRVLIVAGVACVLEFFADKIPWVDSLWDSVHTIVRPLGAGALVAIGFSGNDPALEIILSLLAGGIAFTGHSSKAATRLAVNHSPEPFSNIALSVVEEIAAPALSWIFLTHPLIAFGAVSAFVLLFAWLSPKIWRTLRLETTALTSMIAGWFNSNRRQRVPEAAAALARQRGFDPDAAVIHCAATRSIPGLRSSIGYLFVGDRRALFVARRTFRWRCWDVTFDVLDVRRGIMLDQVVIRSGDREYRLDAFKGSPALPVSV
jgi:hypothetical protein